jgi:hypothetical protein
MFENNQTYEGKMKHKLCEFENFTKNSFLSHFKTPSDYHSYMNIHAIAIITLSKHHKGGKTCKIAEKLQTL